MRILVLGQGGRESAIASRIANDASVYALLKHKNPSILNSVECSNGKYIIGNPEDPKQVVEFATSSKIDLALVSSDSLLEAGIVDALIKHGIKTVGATKSAAEIEWNKSFSRNFVNDIDPEFNPFYKIAYSKAEVENIFQDLPCSEVAVKPAGLTAGKGVKVMGAHLKDLLEAKKYALSIFEDGIGNVPAVIIEEKIEGVEFNLQCFSDGQTVVIPPITFDYPYRLVGDYGPGTGGMGSYNLETKTLDFVNSDVYTKASNMAKLAIEKLADIGREFSGILYPSFFLTKKRELKLIEFNARFGDPESINILMILNSSLTNILSKIQTKSLSSEDVEFKPLASIVFYLVSPGYAYNDSNEYRFEIKSNSILEKNDTCELFFSSAEHLENNVYRSIGNSRTLAIGGTGSTLVEARNKALNFIHENFKGDLQFREDIGSVEDIERNKLRV